MFEHVQEHGRGCMLAHCMGLGKTLQALYITHSIAHSNTAKPPGFACSPKHNTLSVMGRYGHEQNQINGCVVIRYLLPGHRSDSCPAAFGSLWGLQSVAVMTEGMNGPRKIDS